jgi:hypothetical protein
MFMHRVMSQMRNALLALITTTVLFGSSMANAAPPPRDIPSAFVVAKSSNKNQVHYAVRVNETCAPDGAAPVHPYWRMFEKSADATEPLEDREARVLGIDRQDVDGNSIRIVVRALPARPITIHTWRAADGTCAASATLTIAGANAKLHDVYVKIKLFSVDYLMLNGSTDDGAVVHERLTL